MPNDDPQDINESDRELTKKRPLSPREISADLDLVRATIKDHGRTLGDVERQLSKLNEEIEVLRLRCRRNANNLRLLADRLGIEMETTVTDDSQKITQAEPEGSPSEATTSPESPKENKT